MLGGAGSAGHRDDAFGELIVTPHSARKWRLVAERGWAERELILIQVGNKRTMRRGLRRRRSNSKYWPEENWAQVLRGLRELHPQAEILLLGVPQESALNEAILRARGIPGAHNVVHELSIPQTARPGGTRHRPGVGRYRTGAPGGRGRLHRGDAVWYHRAFHVCAARRRRGGRMPGWRARRRALDAVH